MLLLIIGFAFIALWLLGFIVFHVSGWLIHILLVVAVVVILIRIIIGG